MANTETNNYNKEQLDILRRIADRGLKASQEDYFRSYESVFNKYIDLFQHILDELERIKL